MHELLRSLNLQEWTEVARTGVHVLLILLLAWLARKLVDRLLELLRRQMTQHVDDVDHAKRAATLVRVLSYLASVGISLLAGVMVLHELGIVITPFLAAAGVAGVAVGFGAQSLVKDYFTGIVMLLEDQARVGDSIEAGGKSGVVEAVTLRHIRLRDYEGHVHYVPNGTITTVTNRSRGYCYAMVDLSLAAGESIDAALKLMHEVGHALRDDEALKPYILGEVDLAGVEKWTEAGVVLRARIKTEPQHQDMVRRAYLKALKEAFALHHMQVTQGG